MSAPDLTGVKGLPLPQPPAIQRFFSSVIVSVAIYLIIVGAIVYGSYVGAQNMGYNWQWHRVPQYLYTFTDDGFQLGEIFYGLLMTLRLSLTAFVLATADPITR